MTDKHKPWFAELATYDESVDAVSYKVIERFADSFESEEWINRPENINRPVAVMHEDCVDLVNLGGVCLETKAFKQEHKKVKDR